jgi:hypothetical protein
MMLGKCREIVYTGTCLRVVVPDAIEKVHWQHRVTHFTTLAGVECRACSRAHAQHYLVAKNQRF